jgi:hypothetical protein
MRLANQTGDRCLIEGRNLLIAFNVRFLREVPDVIKTQRSP